VAAQLADLDRVVARRIDSSRRQRHRQKQLQWVIEYRLKPVLNVEVGRGFILCMHEEEFRDDEDILCSALCP
jgi:hypothetical protein